jgi:asparagine synthase (glutamine-hydrolysing)
LDPFLLHLLRSGHLRQFMLESWSATEGDQRRWRALLYLFIRMLPYELQKQYYRLRDPDRFKSIQALSPINPGFARRMHVDERFRRFHYDPLFIGHGDSSSLRPGALQADFFSHLGQIVTKHSLAYGVVERDPTMDKRVIEFCLRVPDGQYMRNGQARMLVRRAMRGLLPDKVRLNKSEFGTQSADWSQRLQPCWTELKTEIDDIGALDAEREYLDVPRIRMELDKIVTLEDHGAANPALRMLIRSLIFSRWLRSEEAG